VPKLSYRKLVELPKDNALSVAFSPVGTIESFNVQDAIEELEGITRREVLSAARTYYVRTNGSDSNDGLANTAGGAFLTIQKAVDVASEIDANGNLVTIQVADGTYTEQVTLKSPVGSSSSSVSGFGCNLTGNTGTPANVVIDGGIFAIGDGCQWYVDGFKFTQDASSPYLLWGHAGGWLRLGRVDIGTTTSYQVVADYNGTVEFMDDYSITGGAQFHAVANFGGTILTLSGVTVTITGTPAFSAAFVYAGVTSQQIWDGVTFSGSATGSRYIINMNSAVYTNTADVNFFPGNGAGSTATGGQYS
jgi:hypothetical protein